MLRWRLLSAGLILGLVISLVVLDFHQVVGPPGACLLPLLLAIVMLGTEEVLSLFAAKNLRPVAWTVYAGALLVSLAFGLPLLTPLLPALGSRNVDLHAPPIALCAATALIFAAEMRRFTAPGQHVIHVALAVFAVVYVSVLGGFLVALRLLNGDNALGMTALVSMLVVVKTSDVGAYFFGRTLGSTKFTPKLSPGKTVEGAIGGIAAACVASWFYFHFIAPRIMAGHSTWTRPSWTAMMLYGLALAGAAILGDLAESLLKRDMQRKDSSTWLPGLGGVLDVIDSILFGAPVAYLCWQAGLLS